MIGVCYKLLSNWYDSFLAVLNNLISVYFHMVQNPYVEKLLFFSKCLN